MKNPHWTDAVERIMKPIHDMADDSDLELLIQTELEKAFELGYSRAYKAHAQVKEDMGR